MTIIPPANLPVLVNILKPSTFKSEFHTLSSFHSAQARKSQVARGRQDPGKGCYWAINHLHSLEKQVSNSLFLILTLINPASIREVLRRRRRASWSGPSGAEPACSSWDRAWSPSPLISLFIAHPWKADYSVSNTISIISYSWTFCSYNYTPSSTCIF